MMTIIFCFPSGIIAMFVAMVAIANSAYVPMDFYDSPEYYDLDASQRIHNRAAGDDANGSADENPISSVQHALAAPLIPSTRDEKENEDGDFGHFMLWLNLVLIGSGVIFLCGQTDICSSISARKSDAATSATTANKPGESNKKTKSVELSLSQTPSSGLGSGSGGSGINDNLRHASEGMKSILSDNNATVTSTSGANSGSEKSNLTDKKAGPATSTTATVTSTTTTTSGSANSKIPLSLNINNIKSGAETGKLREIGNIKKEPLKPI